MRLLVWLVRAAVFFTLFAFALNNRDEATIHWFFEQQWRAPMVIIVLAAFALGCAFGIVAMVPSWWRHRRLARTRKDASVSSFEPVTMTAATEPPLQHPPRDGL
jgi:uncharacterized integral membrane protein